MKQFGDGSGDYSNIRWLSYNGNSKVEYNLSFQAWSYTGVVACFY